MLNNVASTMMTGILGALFFPAVILPIIGVNKKLWLITISTLSILAFPLIILEYYFTRERITLEDSGDTKKEAVGSKKQLKAIFSDKYSILIFAYFTINLIAAQLKNTSLGDSQQASANPKALTGLPCLPRLSGIPDNLFGTLYMDRFFDFMVAGSKGTKMPRGDKQQIMNYPVVLPDTESLNLFNGLIGPMLDQIATNYQIPP